MLKAGIIGLPNVGKSTLFNALTRSHKALVENYPFSTIEPNLGVVAVPDDRLTRLTRVVGAPTRIPATVEFVDIAGLVKGASQGEGLGNKFLSHIRDVDAVVHVLRCFPDPDIHHVTGSLDALRDIGIVNTELVLADLEAVQKRRERMAREVKHGDKAAVAEDQILGRLAVHLNTGQLANTLRLVREELSLLKNCPLLTLKPTLFAANVKESQLAAAGEDPQVAAVRAYASAHLACATVIISAQLEAELADLSPEDAAAYLHELGVSGSGVEAMIRATYQLLNLRTFFTFNERECRAWTVHAGDTAPKAAGVIHTDFERGFIKAETVRCEDLVKCGSLHHARERGLYRLEGKDYVVQDGDVIHFKFHV